MRIWKNIVVYLILLVIIGVAFSTYNLTSDKTAEMDIGTLIERVNAGEVKAIAITESKLTVTLTDDSQAVSHKERGESLSELFANYNIDPAVQSAIKVSVEQESGFSYWMGVLIPIVLPVLILVGVIWFMMRQVQGANTRALSFGQSGARQYQKNDKDRITFADVAGAKEAKEELMEVVEFLQNPKKFAAVGAKIPKGVLLMGPPGTGKTLLARAVAGQANVPFFHISGSEFVEMFVGVGASRVRDLFQRAKKSAPCIIFVDEIDAVGRQRGTGLGGSHDEREQTLNQILVEMDGFDPHVGLVVLSGTNRPDVLDPALLRPGRFDRRVVLDLPDIKDREDILKIHAKGKPLAENANLREIAERTPGMAGADLANTLNEAAILAARRNKRRIEMSELREAVEKVLLGPERRSRVFSEHEREVTAYHEGGHALVAHSLPYADPVHKISIISRGQAVGYTMKLPSEDKHLRARREFIDDLAMMLGGFVAEKEIFGDVTTGASNDLEQATKLSRRIITQYGMSEKLGPRTFGDREELIFLGRDIREQRNYSEKIAEEIDQEIHDLINGAMETARSIIRKKHAMLEKIVGALMEKETLEREEFEALCGPPASTKREPPAPQRPRGSGIESTERTKRAPKTEVAIKPATP